MTYKEYPVPTEPGFYWAINRIMSEPGIVTVGYDKYENKIVVGRAWLTYA